MQCDPNLMDVSGESLLVLAGSSGGVFVAVVLPFGTVAMAGCGWCCWCPGSDSVKTEVV